ncbi:MAG: ROK family protein [Verrucomicrobiota bacterium]|nr:ROK family protein [Verrucomicrobiota bacterium]
MNDSSLIGIEIGGTKLQVVMGRADGEIMNRKRFLVDGNRGAEGIRQQIIQAVHILSQGAPSIAGVGVGFGGPVDRDAGCIACSHQVEGWSGFAIQSWLEELSGAPVIVDNDANVAALGEALKGAGSGLSSIFYVTLGSGVGGGTVMEGQIYHGTYPGESEIGHLRLDRNGTIVEQACSGWAVDRKIRQAVAVHPASQLATSVGNLSSGEASVLAQTLDAGCPVAQGILKETLDSLAFALSHVVHLIHPEAIVLGGGLSLLGERLRGGVESELPKWIMDVFGSGPQIKLSTLREDVVPVGALLMAGQKTMGRIV